jgi:acylphosphatase
MNCKRLIISGRVQGVGFRVWMVEKARELGVSGWVRNRIDGSIEALVAGDTAAVEELLRL